MKKRDRKIAEEVYNTFAEKAKISGGNLFEVDQKQTVQEDIDRANLRAQAVANSNRKINRVISAKLDAYKIPDFYLLQLHANYFANTIKYKTDNINLLKILPGLIRLAFIDGKAGVYWDDQKQKPVPIYLGKIKYDIYGDLEEIEYIESTYISWEYDWFNNDKKVLKTISGSELKKVAIFKWGTLALSAWLIVWKFVQFHGQLLRMINSSSFFVAKKGLYNVENNFITEEEMQDFFDPDKPFIKKRSDLDINNKFDTFDHKNSNSADLIEYYRQVIAAYYALIGRRVNQDFKQERNLTGEIQTSEENYNILERDWLLQFEIFCKELKNINSSLNVEPLYKMEEDFKNEATIQSENAPQNKTEENTTKEKK